MRKKHAKTVAASSNPLLDTTDREEYESLLKWISKVEQIRKTHAATIIVNGLWGSGVEYWGGVVVSLAHDDAGHEIEALGALFARLEIAAPGSTRGIRCNKRVNDADDLLSAVSNAYL